ncbi:exported hypothetical protein [Candidatus Terasakiella magnetica]|nr:exported hypothetical protein [Candidatus Terasakiella magnetica]
MKTRAAFAIIATLAGTVSTAHAGDFRTPAQAPYYTQTVAVAATEPAAPQSDDNRMLVAGLGAIAGVVVMNLAMGGVGALPFMYEAGAAAGTAATGAVAASRVLAVTAGVAGALVADRAFRRSATSDPQTVSRTLSNKVSPR